MERFSQPPVSIGTAMRSFAPDTPVHLVKEALPRLFRSGGVRSVGWRAFLPMLHAGSKLARPTLKHALFALAVPIHRSCEEGDTILFIFPRQTPLSFCWARRGENGIVCLLCSIFTTRVIGKGPAIRRGPGLL